MISFYINDVQTLRFEIFLITLRTRDSYSHFLNYYFKLKLTINYLQNERVSKAGGVKKECDLLATCGDDPEERARHPTHL